eukprot:3717916-Amphidinium_carterae.1
MPCVRKPSRTYSGNTPSSCEQLGAQQARFKVHYRCPFVWRINDSSGLFSFLMSILQHTDKPGRRTGKLQLC